MTILLPLNTSVMLNYLTFVLIWNCLITELRVLGKRCQPSSKFRNHNSKFF
jgi:hypothetical protein